MLLCVTCAAGCTLLQRLPDKVHKAVKHASSSYLPSLLWLLCPQQQLCSIEEAVGSSSTELEEKYEQDTERSL